MDELLTQFLIEGRDLVAQAHEALNILSQQGGNARAIDALFRATHTLKGSVALFDMNPAEEMLHAAEDLLARARHDRSALGRDELAGLFDIIDQTDRWIEAMEAEGRLPHDAAAVARALKTNLALEVAKEAEAHADSQDWLDVMLARPQFAGRIPTSGATAFRYTPDPECFFRGDDPLATVAAVPDLIAFAILPNGDWPAAEEMDPFRCTSLIEGLSSADAALVQAAFRLTPDQVAFASLGATDSPAREQAMAGGAVTQLRVDAAKLDRLARQAGELAVAVNGLADLANQMGALDRTLAGDLRRALAAIERPSVELRATIADVRSVSLATVLRRLPRLARELASALDKDIDFVLAGDSSEADKQIADALFEPLLHLVRNAIDHGIETSTERMALGKSAKGHVALTIAPRGDRLIVTLQDDGRGIDPALMRKTAVAKGLLSEDAATALTDTQAIRLIFAPGFSTAAAVSDVSGRGIGMDAVLTAIERLQGVIDIDSEPGAGTTFRVDLPLNAITTRLITVTSGEARYGLRLDQVVETLRVESAQIEPVGQGQACVIRDRTVPVIDLAAALGAPIKSTELARLVVTEVTGEPVALKVDRLGETLETVVNEGSGLLAAVPAVGATAVMSDGSVLLVLNIAELIS